MHPIRGGPFAALTKKGFDARPRAPRGERNGSPRPVLGGFFGLRSLAALLDFFLVFLPSSFGA
jgi:hypothetical protein